MKRLGCTFLLPLFLLNGVLGSVTAVAIFEFDQSRHFSSSVSDRAATVIGSLAPSLDHMWPLTWLPAFLSTLSVLPLLLMFLVWAEGRQRRRYWPLACCAGVLFGLAACVMTGFYLPVTMAFAPGSQGSGFDTVLLITVAPFLFAFAFALVIPFKYFWAVVLAGVAFGVMNGVAVRWRLDRKRRQASQSMG